MKSLEALKKAAAEKAIEFIGDDMVVGLGTGSTAEYFVRRLAELKPKVVCVPTSLRTAEIAQRLGLVVESSDVHEKVDVDVDGADEIDPELNLIKGGGGAHTNEKKVAFKSRIFVVVADYTKLVQKLGGFPVPVEVHKDAADVVSVALRSLGGLPRLREGFVTDLGNIIFDTKFNIKNPKKLEEEINSIAGVVDNGIFAKRRPDFVLVGEDAGVRVIERKNGKKY